MSFEKAFKANQDEKIQEAIEQEVAAKEDVKMARKAIKTKEKEKEEMFKQKEIEILGTKRDLKAAIARRKASTQTKLALQGIDPLPKVGNLYPKC